MMRVQGSDGVPIGESPIPVEVVVRSEADCVGTREGYVWTTGRLPEAWEEGARAAQQMGLPICIDSDGYYWFAAG